MSRAVLILALALVTGCKVRIESKPDVGCLTEPEVRAIVRDELRLAEASRPTSDNP